MVKRRKNWKARIYVGLTLLLIVGVWIFKTRKPKTDVVPVFKVQEGPMAISVTSSGSIQSRDKITLSSELEGNNTVIWVIDEGVNVKPGDLLLEFNASELIEKRKEQEVIVANAESSVIIAEERLGITKGDAAAALLDGETDLMLSKMDLKKYESGDYPQQLRQFEADITLADEEVQRAAEKLEWSNKLAKEGFLTRMELQADELALQRKQIDIEMAKTRMNVLTNYTVVQQRSALDSKLRRAERALARVAWQNKATLRQVESELRTRYREQERATNRLEQLNQQIEKSKIYSPTNGIILYASTVQIARRQFWVKPLAVGVTAVERQEMIYIPLDLGMVVEVMISEASLTKIETGMAAKIKIDAFPGRAFDGKLVKIGLLPDGQSSYLNPDLKLYKCEIECDFRDVTIRPGMSCDVELIKETYKKTLYAPVQCVVREEGVSKVYVRKKGEWEARPIKVGLDNNRMIRILEGVRAGDELMLAPPIKETVTMGREPDSDVKQPPAGRGEAPPGTRARSSPVDGAKKREARPKGGPG